MMRADYVDADRDDANAHEDDFDDAMKGMTRLLLLTSRVVVSVTMMAMLLILYCVW